MVERNPRPNWYDGQKSYLETIKLEQDAAYKNSAFSNSVVLGDGVLLNHPAELLIFDSDALSSAQQGWVAVDTFDGRGVLESVYTADDLNEGAQIAVTLENSRVLGSVHMTCIILGKTFEDSLIYEEVVFTKDGTLVTKNHFKEVTNLLFQNLFGNTNVSVDGIGSFDTISEIDGVSGRVFLTEVSSFTVSHDEIIAEQKREPNLLFRDFKSYDSGKTLQTVLEEAVGPSNDPDDLDINTTTALTREFSEGGSTELIIGQKFKMSGTGIQKITLLLGLSDDTIWSGNLVVGIRPLLTSTNCSTDFLPDNAIDFDPSTNPLEEITVDMAQLAEQGVVLTTTTQPVDFVFTNTLLSNPNLSRLVNNDYFVITIRRIGSPVTGTIFLEESVNTDSEQQMTIFSNGSWTNVSTSAIWYKIFENSLKVASGVSFSEGTRLPIVKTKTSESGAITQHFECEKNLVNSGEGAENYLIVEKGLAYSQLESNPRVGDLQATEVEDVPEFKVLEQDELITNLISNPKTVTLARARDNNPRSNPVISGTIDFPGLALGNTIHIVSPGSDLLTQNVVGSTIIPDILQPTIKYRIIGQDLYTDLYGDVNGDGTVDVFDEALISDYDGYQSFLATTGTYTSDQQIAAVVANRISMLEILRGDVDSTDTYELTSVDAAAINAFYTSGTALPNGSSFSRITLTLEPLLDPLSDLNTFAESQMNLETDNPNLINPALFSPVLNIGFQIDFVPSWFAQDVEIVDLRRFVTTTFSDFSSDNLSSTPETGGKNNLFVPGSLYLTDGILNLDGTTHKLDFESNDIDIELPSGDTQGELNIFEEYVVGKMKFSDGSFVSSSSLNNSQVKLGVSISSHVKNVSDGLDGYLDFDGYNDGYGANADEAIGTYLDHSTGLLRIRAFNIVENLFFPELRTRIVINIELKKSGFVNSDVFVSSSELVLKLIS